MKQGPIFLFVAFVGICAGAAKLLGVDLSVVIDAVSKALSGGK